MSGPALDVKEGTTPVREDAGQEMNSLVCSNLGVNDGKAMAILHYPKVALLRAEAGGFHTSSSGSPSQTASTPATNTHPSTCTHPSPTGLNSQRHEIAHRGEGREANPCKTVTLGPREKGKDQALLLRSQSPDVIDSDEKVLAFPVGELQPVAGAGRV